MDISLGANVQPTTGDKIKKAGESSLSSHCRNEGFHPKAGNAWLYSDLNCESPPPHPGRFSSLPQAKAEVEAFLRASGHPPATLPEVFLPLEDKAWVGEDPRTGWLDYLLFGTLGKDRKAEGGELIHKGPV